MIDITADRDKLIKNLKELEAEYSQDKISKRDYNRQKNELEGELETVDTINRIKRLQGKESTERPLEYWSEKKKEEDDEGEKEELFRKYVTTPTEYNRRSEKKKGGISKVMAISSVILAAIFLAGIGFGVLFMEAPSESTSVAMVVNESAFPTINSTVNVTTNVTKTTTKKSTNSTKPITNTST